MAVTNGDGDLDFEKIQLIEKNLCDQIAEVLVNVNRKLWKNLFHQEHRRFVVDQFVMIPLVILMIKSLQSTF